VPGNCRQLIVPADYMATLAAIIAGDGIAAVSEAALLAFNPPPGQAN
jgi:hypothetical protein